MASSVEPLRIFSITLVSRFDRRIPVIDTPLCEVGLVHKEGQSGVAKRGDFVTRVT